MTVIGTPQGATRAMRSHFGDKAKVGAKGERFTLDELMKLFERAEETVVFNGLSLPGWESADADHVVLRGNRAVVVDSKCWAPGRYWSSGKSIFRGRKRFSPAEQINLTRIANELTAYLELDVQPLVVVWPSRPGRIATRRPLFSLRMPDATPYCIGRDLASTLRRLLGPEDLPFDSEAFKRLRALVRSERTAP